MNATADTTTQMRRRGGVSAAVLLALAIALSLSVLVINRGPLFYFDSGSYFKQGNVALELVLPGKPVTDATAGEGAGGPAIGEDDDTTVGSRSIVFALLVAGFWRAGALIGLPVFSLAIVLLAVWLPVRVTWRYIRPSSSVMLGIALPLLVAASGALPFYIAYVMPDIFAPVLLLVVATLTVMGRDMRLFEILLALALGMLAVVVHPSHLAIALLLVPLVALLALIQSRRRWWLPPTLVLLIVITGFAERKAFEFMAENVAEKEVVYNPFMTVRLIVDGPGLRYLEERCPDPDIATCALLEALSRSDDPRRLSASRIMFDTSPETGSLRLLDAADQQRIAAEQRAFFRDVLISRPISTVYAFAANTVRQVFLFSIVQTIPTDGVLESVRDLTGKAALQGGVLADLGRDWIENITVVHRLIYILSLGVIVMLLIRPGKLPGPVRAFAVFILLGILANAFVMGAVSQPANRYGARVIWLLPFTATFLIVALRAAGHGAKPPPGEAK